MIAGGGDASRRGVILHTALHGNARLPDLWQTEVQGEPFGDHVRPAEPV
jgi:hypothetical protein